MVISPLLCAQFKTDYYRIVAITAAAAGVIFSCRNILIDFTKLSGRDAVSFSACPAALIQGRERP